MSDKDTTEQPKPTALPTALELLREARNKYQAEPVISHDEGIGVTSTSTKEVIVGSAILLAAIGFFIFLLVRHGSERSVEHETENKAITSMITKFNADTEWKGKLENIDRLLVSDARGELIRKDNQPVFLIVRATEVTSRDSRQICHLDSPVGDETPIRFFLECSPEHVKIINDNKRERPAYAVVARISEVHTASQEELRAKDRNSEKLIASGQCLDLIKLDFYYD